MRWLTAVRAASPPERRAEDRKPNGEFDRSSSPEYLCRTLTRDRGKELARHTQLTVDTRRPLRRSGVHLCFGKLPIVLKS
jgi:hypothetical protein